MVKKFLLFCGLALSLATTAPSFATQNISVEYSEYLTIAQNDRVLGMHTDGEYVYIAIVHPQATYQQHLSTILKFHTRNKQFQTEINIPERIQDFAVKNGKIYIAHSSGIRIMNEYGAGQQDIWIGNIQKIAVSSQGEVVVLSDRREVILLSSSGNVVKTISIPKTSIEALSIDSRNGRIFVAGYDNKVVNNFTTSVAFVHAYDMQGYFVYKVFDFETYEFGQNTAPTKITDIFSGDDGLLYVLGDTVGRNTIFQFNGKTASGYSPVVNIDDYSDISKSGERKMAYIAKISPFDGTVQMAQFSYPRGYDSLPSEYDTHSGNIVADSAGNIVFSGNTAFATPESNNIRIGNTNITQHATTNGTLQALASNLQSRYLWTSFSRNGSSTTIQDLSLVNGNTIAILGTGNDVVTTQTGGNSDVFLMLIPFAKNTTLPKYSVPNYGIQYPNTPNPPVTPPNNQIDRPYVTPNSPYTAQEGRDLIGLQKYFDNIRNTLNQPNLTNLQKLEVVKVNPITPRNPQALKLYILLSGEFNRKKDHLLKNRTALSRSELDALYKYTEDLYHVAMTMDQGMKGDVLRPYLVEFLKSYQAMNQIK